MKYHSERMQVNMLIIRSTIILTRFSRTSFGGKNFVGKSDFPVEVRENRKHKYLILP